MSQIVGVLRHMENSAPSLKISRTKFPTSALYNGRDKYRRQNRARTAILGREISNKSFL